MGAVNKLKSIIEPFQFGQNMVINERDSQYPLICQSDPGS